MTPDEPLVIAYPHETMNGVRIDAAVLPTADAPTAEREPKLNELLSIFENCEEVYRLDGLTDEADKLRSFASRLPSLIAADADRERDLLDVAKLVRDDRATVYTNGVCGLRTAYPSGGNRVQNFATMGELLRAARSPEGEPNV